MLLNITKYLTAFVPYTHDHELTAATLAYLGGILFAQFSSRKEIINSLFYLSLNPESCDQNGAEENATGFWFQP